MASPHEPPNVLADYFAPLPPSAPTRRKTTHRSPPAPAPDPAAPSMPLTVQGYPQYTTQRELDDAIKGDRQIDDKLNKLVKKLVKKEYNDKWIDVLWTLGSIRGPGPAASGVGTLANSDVIRSLGKAILHKGDINPLDILELQGESTHLHLKIVRDILSKIIENNPNIMKDMDRRSKIPLDKERKDVLKNLEGIPDPSFISLIRITQQKYEKELDKYEKEEMKRNLNPLQSKFSHLGKEGFKKKQKRTKKQKKH